MRKVHTNDQVNRGLRYMVGAVSHSYNAIMRRLSLYKVQGLKCRRSCHNLSLISARNYALFFLITATCMPQPTVAQDIPSSEVDLNTLMQSSFANMLVPKPVVQHSTSEVIVSEGLEEVKAIEAEEHLYREEGVVLVEDIKPVQALQDSESAQVDVVVAEPQEVIEEARLKVDAIKDTGFFGQAGEVLPLVLGGRHELIADVADPVGVVEAVALALRNNFEVKASTENLESARWDKYGAYSQYLPVVEFSSSRGSERSRPGSYNNEDGQRVLDTKHFRTDRSLSIRQPLIDTTIVADIYKFHSSEDLAQEQHRDVNEDIALKTVTVFFQLLQARKSSQLVDQYKSYLGKLHDRMKARVEGGGGVRADLDRIKSRLMLAQAQQLEIMGQYSTKLGEFRRLTRSTPSLLKVPRTFSPSVPPSVDEALSIALKHNPEYLSSLEKVEVAKGDRDRSVSNLLPKLSLEYSRINTYNAGGSAGGNPIDGVYPKQDDERLMLVASWSLAGGTSVTSGVSGHAKVRQMMMLSRDVRARVESVIRIGYDALHAAQQRVSILEETYNVDRRVANDFEEQYKQGNRSLFELLDAYERMHTAQQSLMRTIIAKTEVAYQIQRQLGNLTQSIIGDEGI